MANLIWIGSVDGFWDDADNWENGLRPGPLTTLDDVIISNEATDLTTTHRLGNTVIRKLTSTENFVLSRGSLTADEVEVDGTFTIDGGRLIGATINQANGRLNFSRSSNNQLDNVNIVGNILLSNRGFVRFQNNSTVTGDVVISADGFSAYFQNSSIWTGNVELNGLGSKLGIEDVAGQVIDNTTIRMDGRFSTFGVLGNSNVPLTLGPNTQVLMNNQATISGGVERNIPNRGSIINQGNVIADGSKSIDKIRSITSNSFTNEGIINIVSGAEMRISPFISPQRWTNAVNGNIFADKNSTITFENNGVNRGNITATNSSRLRFSDNWKNDGIVNLTDSELELGGSYTTDGIGKISRSGSTNIYLEGILDNRNSTLDLDSRGTYILSDGVIQGGTIQQGTNGILAFGGRQRDNRLDNVNIIGNLTITNSGVRFQNASTWTGDAEIIGERATLSIENAAGQTINNKTIRLNGFETSFNVGTDTTLTLGPETQILLSTPRSGIRDDGYLINQGRITGTNGRFRPRFIEPEKFTNVGIVDVSQGSELWVTSAEITNLFTPNTLTGGSWRISDDSVMLLEGGNILNNAATIVLDGPNSQFYSEVGSFSRPSINALANFTNNTATGSLSLLNGRNLTTLDDLNNAGEIIVGSASNLTATGNYIQTTGTTNLTNSTLSATNINFQGGSFSGSGTLAADVTNAAIFAENFSTDTLAITGDYSQTGVLNIEIASLTDFDKFQVGGVANLDGILNVTLLDGFETLIKTGDSFEILTSDTINGQFDEVNILSDLTENLTLAAAYGADNILRLTTDEQPVTLLPDLIVSDISAPSDGFTGDEVEISWTVRNSGDADATGVWTDKVYLSTDDTVREDQLIGNFAFEGTIKMGESLTRRQNITLPEGGDEERFLIVRTDADDQLDENVDKGNNSLVDDQPISIRINENATDSPNLQVTSVTGPGNASSSQEVVINWTVKNSGNQATSSSLWYDEVWLSLDTVLGPDIYLGRVANPSFLNVGESYSNSLTVELPTGIEGNYYFLVRTDADQQVQEIDSEGDNISSSGPTDVELTPPADLQVTSVAAPEQAFSGNSVDLSWTVTNDGAGRTLENRWRDFVYLSADEVIDGSDWQLGGVRHDGQLLSGESYSVSDTFTLPSGVSGDFFFLVQTDGFGQVFENQSEDNNIGTDRPATLVNLTPPPDLELEFLSVPNNANASQDLTFTYQVTNKGSTITPNIYWDDQFYLSTDDQLSLDTDILLGRQGHSGSLDTSASYEETVSFRLPDGFSGTPYLIGVTDASQIVFELDDDNNAVSTANTLSITSTPADLVISAIAPSSGEAGKSILVDWTVTNQGTGESVVSQWSDRITASIDDILGNEDDFILASFFHNGVLQAGENYTRDEVITLPFSLEGDYNLFISTDVGKQVYESSEDNNNTTALSLNIARQTPDLQVTEVSVPVTGETGQDFTVNWTTQNTGAGKTNADSWYDTVYLSTDDVLDQGDRLLNVVRHSGTLESNDSYSTSSTFKLPADLAGDFKVLVQTDQKDEILEAAAENNNVTASGTTSITTGPEPNLVFSNLEAPASAISGQVLELGWTVDNAGADTEQQLWRDSFYLSRDQTFDRATDIYLGTLPRETGLTSGNSYSQTQPFDLPQGISGEFYVVGLTDSTGLIRENGNEADNVAIDATPVNIEFAPPADLTVSNVRMNLADGRIPGESVTVEYTVENIGTNDAIGRWTDSVYLSADDQWDIDDVLWQKVSVSGPVAADGGSYSKTVTAELPGLVPDDYHVVVRSDVRNQLPEVEENNNQAVSTEQFSTSVEALELGVVDTDTLPQGEAKYYRVEVEAGETLLFKLDSASEQSANELYVSYGELPDRTTYDFKFEEAFTADQEIVVPTTQAGTYYVLAYGDYVPEDNTSYSLEASLVDFSIRKLSTTKGSNKGETTVTIQGAKFTADTEAELMSSSGEVRQAKRLFVNGDSEIWATFDLQGLNVEDYQIRVTKEGGNVTAAHSEAFKVTDGPAGALGLRIQAPETVRANQQGVVTYIYENLGETDIQAPQISIAGTDTDFSGGPGEEDDDVDNEVRSFYGTSNGAFGGVLTAGSSQRVSYTFTPGARGTVHCWVMRGSSSTVGGAGVSSDSGRFLNGGLTAFFGGESSGSSNKSSDASTFVGGFLQPSIVNRTWDFYKDRLKPFAVRDDAWDAVWTNFKTEVGGFIAGQYSKVLADNANRLSELGEYVDDDSRLLAFEIQQASNFGELFQRYALGSLGRGNEFIGDLRIATNEEGDVIVDQSGFLRLFEKQADGSYQAQAGDNGVLTQQGETFELQEKYGAKHEFRSDGRLFLIQDPNGNRLNFEYTDGKISRISSSTGDYQDLEINNQGRIVKITDQAGNLVTYNYDSTGELLLSTTNDNGTTSYTYNNQYAITSITDANGVKANFEYDVQGRIIQRSLNDGAEELTYGYDSVGGVTVTDSGGSTTKYFLNDLGQVARLQDDQGRTFRLSYDDAGNITQSIGTDGSITKFTYDNSGNLLTQEDALGQEISFSYEPTLNQITKLTDARGNGLAYGYDAAGNVTQITYADENSEVFEYDSDGNVVSSINLRRQETTYSYNARGQITQLTNVDGTTFSYTYDVSGNLTSAIDGRGTTALAYDDNNRLTKITYPSGRFLAYTYDAGGRRTQMVDHEGNATNYAYDAAGRLTELTDGNSSRIIAYSYDNVGRLIREDNGNATYTTYTYDAIGQTTSIVNHAPDSSVNSRNDYSYDAAGRTTQMTTLDGAWQYDYDATGQLTSAVFISTNTNIENQDLAYIYDAAGNRIRTIVNGIAADYISNNLNQYTTSGGTVFDYDADGNLISKIESGEIWTYFYNSQSQLIRVEENNGTITQYEYDAFGNRISTTHNGERTEYLHDPFGFVNVVGEYDASNKLIARYDHGIGLIRQTNSANESAFYDFDIAGSATGLTGNTGDIQNQYAYLPFGQELFEIETVDNSFEYVGQWGVIEDSNGLEFMRARHYENRLGRFMSLDPIGLQGRDSNLYRYVQNDPINGIDPIGLWTWGVSGNLDAGLGGGATDQIGMAFDGNNSANQATVGGGFYMGVAASATISFNFSNAPSIDALAGNGYSIGVSGGEAIVGGISYFAPMDNSYSGVSVEIGFGLGFPVAVTGFLTSTSNLVTSRPSPKSSISPDKSSTTSATGQTEVIAPTDPNDIIGPTGFGEENWITADETLPYTIRFENIETATAPAQRVTITQTLDPDLDARSFRLGNFGWSGLSFDVPDNSAFYQKRLDLTDDQGFLVEATARIDIASRTAFWTLQTLDPETGEPPTNASVGFLPPNDDNGIGDGFVTYSIAANETAQTGDVIDAQATIVFDIEEPIDTPAIFNTLDAGQPTSTITAQPSANSTEEFTVSWSGNDGTDGSGLSGYNIFVSDNGGEFTPWLQGTTLTEATYKGELDHTYEFYAFAYDNAGNIQPTPATTTYVISEQPSSNAIEWNTETGVVSSFSIDANAGIASTNPIGRTIEDTNWQLQTTGDLNNDGQADVILRHALAGQNLAWYMAPGGQSIQSEALIGRNVPDTNWSIAGTGDFNADGNTDIILRNQAADQIVAWYMDGNGGIQSEALVGRSFGDNNWKIEAVADFNRDNKADLVLRNGLSGQNLLWEMDGGNILAERLSGRDVPDQNWHIEGAKDFDNNGTIDLFLRNRGVGQGLLWSMADKTTIASEQLILNVPTGVSQIVF